MQSSISKPKHKYLKTLHSRYNRLPKVLWDLIWTYDNRYKVEFKKCVNELNIYFNRNRLIDRLNGDISIYNTYMFIQNKYPSSLYAKCSEFSTYYMKKRLIFGDNVVNDNLNHLHNIYKRYPNIFN
jgi:hypothetical protein